jgi:acetamidase/formamidase
MAEHHLDDSVTQPFWDNAVEPRLEINAGDTVVMECAEPTGQVTPDWTAQHLGQIDFSKIHALTGSVFVKGAKPGDVLEVEILDLKHKGWGWSGHLKGFGLLAEDFDFEYMHHWRMEGDTCYSTEMDFLRLPYEPHPGCVGVAPKEAGRLNTIPPRPNGGNMDVRDMTIGATIWMPVFVEGALFATGDCHSAQGQGEVCGTGIESPMTVTMRFNVRKDVKLKDIQVRRLAPLSRRDSKGYHITTAHGPDLMENAKNAVRYMIDWLTENHKMSRSQAYILCSVSGDLKISEIVDAPNWIVSMHMPLQIFSV